MSQAPVMPVFTDALLGDTLHLSTEEFGAYCLLLLATWRNNGRPLPDDDRSLQNICRVSPVRWRNLRPRLISFFSTGDGFWHQKRLEQEWDRVQERLEILRANGAAGGRAKSLKKRNPDLANANGSLVHLPANHEPKSISENLESLPSARANGHDKGEKIISGPSGSLRSPAPSAPLREVKKAQLVQKLMRFAHATMNDTKRRAAIDGLTGLDGEHSTQWWLDHLDQKMRAAHWDDAREQ
jgi:uncharacterized protein YdaU (DUF1376 family)